MRLIDADALIEKINKLEYNNNDKKMEIAGNEVLHSYMPLIIQDALTAYDVEKVVEELEKKEYASCSAKAEATIGMLGTTASFHSGEIEAYRNSIKLIRNGGKE